MTYDMGDTDIDMVVEKLHNRLARTGDDIWITTTEVDGVEKIAVVRGDGIGEHVFENDGNIEILDPDELDAI